ncbi:RNA polymerase factor sigma-54 [Hyphomicrobium sulfonivorans]|uniref:RNA polymerase factor sigma-54 n=1 Tax=Hyphomicrobium sulfonivorans TaxID=121290 RepID=UPI00156FB911|nr:RNA polymerase factor sigma-54 [Hyphomicrobium sulfonivorans]MBI1649567.1 RNA polymerase factor sigma-54 [Hyphomicrobium sulfonivorans]NSL71483.1 RNA polymerase sigma-54 factor [Hyphomicrobium sulfonivorans]
MALATKLEMRQGQQLVMTPQLQQAIRLLQFSNIELAQFLETELERNPLLEADDNTDAPVRAERDSESDDHIPERAATDSAADNTSDASASDTSGDDDGDWVDLERPAADPEGTFDTEYENLYPDSTRTEQMQDATATDSGWASLRQRGAGSGEDVNIEAYLQSEQSLRDHLSEQLPLALSEPVDRLIGQYLIDMVDEAGYLPADFDRIVESLGAPHAKVEQVLSRLQTFDPPGVFARSLAECLALQLKDQNRYDPIVARFLENLDLLAGHNLPALRRAVDIEMDELLEIIAEIKRLNPKPGLKFGSEYLQPVVPDVLVRAAQDGSWIVELNSETLPRVLVNRTYLTTVTKASGSAADRNYLLECLQTANWLVKSLDQRARTILRVAEEIVRQQDAFFTHGVQFLRPLNLRTVADAISMHESTVSRVTSNKYMATPRGIFEMKYFFTSAIASAEDGAESHSSEAVRHRIKQMIDGESSASVLSDDKIVELLKTDGIDIARRTVAKYREAMRIPSSVQRRRDKRLVVRVSQSEEAL